MSKVYIPSGRLIASRSGVGNVAVAYTDATASDEFARAESAFVMLAIRLDAGNPSNCTSFDMRLLARPLQNSAAEGLSVAPASGQGGFLIPTFDAEATNNPPTLVTSFNVAITAGQTKWVLRRVPEHLVPGFGAFIFQHKMNGAPVQSGDGIKVYATY